MSPFPGQPPKPAVPVTTEPQPPEASPAHAHRVERYAHLGFTETDAQLLACAKDADGFFIYWGDVDRMLEAGCDHAKVVAILA